MIMRKKIIVDCNLDCKDVRMHYPCSKNATCVGQDHHGADKRPVLLILIHPSEIYRMEAKPVYLLAVKD
jgi:hypothetical protein